jgi:hypothetical protein
VSFSPIYLKFCGIVLLGILLQMTKIFFMKTKFIYLLGDTKKKLKIEENKSYFIFFFSEKMNKWYDFSVSFSPIWLKFCGVVFLGILLLITKGFFMK